MNLLIKQPLFWIATTLFLILGVGALLYLMPPLVSDLSNSRAKIQELNSQISEKQNYLAQVAVLKDDGEAIESYYATAGKALPTSVETDSLLLQLEGMVNILRLSGATITVPFSTAATTAASSSSEGVTTGGSANSTTSPVVKSNGSQTTFTISGKFGFNDMRTLLQSLRSFSRWNKITSIELTKSGDEYSATVISQIFWLSGDNLSFSGSTAFLSTAKSLFSDLKSYSTAPDVTTEGSYGRSDPFAN